MKTQYANAVTQYENGTSLGGRIIKEGGLVVFPTETVYGLGANGLNSEAVLKIFAAKGRPADNPLILHIAKKSELKPLWSHVPDNARILADTFWPGPLTMIFNRSSIVPDEVTAGLDTVAVRMPLNKTARADKRGGRAHSRAEREPERQAQPHNGRARSAGHGRQG